MYSSSEKMAKTIGKLAEKIPEVGETLSTANIMQRISIPYAGAFGVIKQRLKQIYESVESPQEDTDVPTLIVHDKVTIRQESENYVMLQWSSDPISDMVLDSVVAMILNIKREGPKLMPVDEEVSKTAEEMEKMAQKVTYALFVSLFGDVKVGEGGKFVLTVDGDVACVHGKNGEVECENESLKERVKTAFGRIPSAVRPILLSAS